MEKISGNLENKQPSVLILADFSDGSWHAISFAMQFLHEKKSPLSILQTYQNPKFGRFMLRDIIPQLKEITIHELGVLKTKLLENYKIEKESINTLSLEGELNQILQYKPLLKESYNIVLSTHSSFTNSCTIQNQYLTKVIDSSNSPLFILPQKFEEKENCKILFVGNTSKVPSLHITSQIVSICKKTNSELEILFVVEKQNQKMNEEVAAFFKEHFNEIDYAVNYCESKSVAKGMKKYMTNNCKDLIVVESQTELQVVD